MLGYSELVRIFGRIGLMSFGGPAAQIALMHRELVETRDWLTDEEYVRALSFCMLLPGPEAMQLATYAGWKLRGIPGGLIAGGLFVIPGAILILALAAGYSAFGELPVVSALFLGIKACVVVIVIEALLRVAKRALKSNLHRTLAVAAFVAIFALGLPFPLIILAAALIGAFLHGGPAAKPAPVPPLVTQLPVIGAGLAAWAGPVLALWLVGAQFLVQIAVFFSTLAIVTFGGAYAVLAYMTQTVVQTHGWLTTPQMMDALGLAETTPGPLILVTEFVGFVAGHGVGGWGLALAAALLTLWVTFVPCFLWVFAFAPYIEWSASRPRLGAALQGVTAAVVGVIANLALWFALHLFFKTQTKVDLGPISLALPDLTTLDLSAAAIALGAGILLLRMHVGLGWVLGLSALAGLALGGLV